MLTDNQLKEFEVRLRSEKTNIEAQLKKLDEGLDFGDDVDHLEEESDETEEFANRLGTRKVLEARLAEINAALQKIKRGSYGRCEQCSKNLSMEMLEVNPESVLCRECKSAIS